MIVGDIGPDAGSTQMTLTAHATDGHVIGTPATATVHEGQPFTVKLEVDSAAARHRVVRDRPGTHRDDRGHRSGGVRRPDDRHARRARAGRLLAQQLARRARRPPGPVARRPDHRQPPQRLQRRHRDERQRPADRDDRDVLAQPGPGHRVEHDADRQRRAARAGDRRLQQRDDHRDAGVGRRRPGGADRHGDRPRLRELHAPRHVRLRRPARHRLPDQARQHVPGRQHRGPRRRARPDAARSRQQRQRTS